MTLPRTSNEARSSIEEDINVDCRGLLFRTSNPVHTWTTLGTEPRPAVVSFRPPNCPYRHHHLLNSVEQHPVLCCGILPWSRYLNAFLEIHYCCFGTVLILEWPPNTQAWSPQWYSAPCGPVWRAVLIAALLGPPARG